MKKIRYINGFDMLNTFRYATVSVWFQGCEHRCKGCFNPETWKTTDNRITTKDIEEFEEKLIGDGILKDVAYLGGDPFFSTNRDSLLTLMIFTKECSPKSKQFAWTGYQFETLYKLQLPHLKFLDVIVDGKYEESKKVEGTKFGSSNQRVWIKEDGVWKQTNKYHPKEG